MAQKKAAKKAAKRAPTLIERLQAAAKKRTDRSRARVTEAHMRRVDAAVDGTDPRKRRKKDDR